MCAIGNRKSNLYSTCRRTSIRQDTIGTTRSRVNFLLNKFKKLGFIEYDGELPLKVNRSLLSVVLHD